MTQLDLAIAADRARSAIAISALQVINSMVLSRPDERYPIISCLAAAHYAGFDQQSVPDALFDQMLEQTDGHAQAWVEGRRR